MNLSIHPRNWPTGNKIKVNTAATQKRKRTKNQENLERRRLDCIRTREALASEPRKKPVPWDLAFKMPGSNKK